MVQEQHVTCTRAYLAAREVQEGHHLGELELGTPASAAFLARAYWASDEGQACSLGGLLPEALLGLQG